MTCSVLLLGRGRGLRSGATGDGEAHGEDGVTGLGAHVDAAAVGAARPR